MNKDIKQVKPMLCPVCGEFYFTELDEDDIEMGETPNSCRCSRCGWLYDLEQTADPDLADGANALSLNQYKKEYQAKIKANPDYDYAEEHRPAPVPHPCPVCGEYTFPYSHSYDICPSCGWEDDDFFEGGGANEMSLEEAKADFQKKRAADPKYKWEDACLKKQNP